MEQKELEIKFEQLHRETNHCWFNLCRVFHSLAQTLSNTDFDFYQDENINFFEDLKVCSSEASSQECGIVVTYTKDNYQKRLLQLYLKEVLPESGGSVLKNYALANLWFERYLTCTTEEEQMHYKELGLKQLEKEEKACRDGTEEKDLNNPSRPIDPFNYFLEDLRQQEKELEAKDLTEEALKRWGKMTKETQAPYKERYRQAMKEYRETRNRVEN